MIRAHFTGGGGLWAAALAGVVLLFRLATVPAMAASAPAPADAVTANAHWIRLERRIESGYFRQDAAALQSLAARLSAGEKTTAAAGKDGEEWRSYYAALLAYRLALLEQHDEPRAWPFTRQCVKQLDRTLALDAGSAEALALQSACLALQSRLDPWRSPLAAPRSLARIHEALRLAPRNPRVLLLGALGDRNRPRLFGGDRQQAFALLRRSVSAFERQRGQPPGVPGWGAADAFTDLAQDYLVRGEAVAARNVLERALLVAPDFAQARQLMAEIVSG